MILKKYFITLKAMAFNVIETIFKIIKIFYNIIGVNNKVIKYFNLEIYCSNEVIESFFDIKNGFRGISGILAQKEQKTSL